MANTEHFAKLRGGTTIWNQWRKENPDVRPDLRNADLHGRDLRNADLRKADMRNSILHKTDLRNANLCEATLLWASLSEADLDSADLRGTDLREAALVLATLSEAKLIGASMRGASLLGADLTAADVSGADLTGADLRHATLVETNLEGANLTSCSVYGISAWNVRLEGAIQSNLVITPHGESPIQVDNLEVAQFIYLLLNNEKIRHVIDTITSKVVLILGRFTPERKLILDAIRDELRRRDYLPVLFDFEKPANRDLTGTISTLANMARFIIADLTDPNSVPHELATIIPLTVVPIQAIILEGRQTYPMFEDYKRRYSWVLEPHQYQSEDQLLAQLGERVIAPAEAKAKELARK